MTLENLKAKAYDTLAQIEYLQIKLKELNQQIADFKPEEETDKKDL